MGAGRGARAGLGLVTAAVLAVACSGGDEEAVRPLDETLRLNDIQVIGTHDSYHLEPEPPLLAAIRTFGPDFAQVADSAEYSHLPLVEQFDTQGIRQIELDVFADSDGGLYAAPVGPGLAGLPVTAVPAMAEPGFKVLHAPDIDAGSTCPTLVTCLEVVRDWSTTHPGHVPILILIEVKQDPVDDPLNAGFATPEAIDADALDALDEEIRSVFAPEELLVPDDVRGDRDSLEDAVLQDGWPTLAAARGRVLFALDNTDAVLDLYVDGHAALDGRAMFTSSPVGSPEAAFLKLNDPITDADAIREAVADGYVVRTRADADTAQARTGEEMNRDAALASGAQWVSTDYPVDDPRFPPAYVVAIPDGTPARCNPVRGPEDCSSRAIEDPDLLGIPAERD